MPEPESISVLIPTYNEAQNVEWLLPKLIAELRKTAVKYEILIIDDASCDHTADIAEAILRENGRAIRRIACKRSLSLSILDGMKEARNAVIIVMDADGSHPPELIPVFLMHLGQGYDLVIASRYCGGGGTKDFPVIRLTASLFACLIGRLLTPVKDNTSGFFAIKKDALEHVLLSPKGFKIGLEVFVKANFNRFKEVPYVFVNRKKGKSKFKPKVILEYFQHILSLLSFRLSRRCF